MSTNGYCTGAWGILRKREFWVICTPVNYLHCACKRHIQVYFGPKTLISKLISKVFATLFMTWNSKGLQGHTFLLVFQIWVFLKKVVPER